MSGVLVICLSKDVQGFLGFIYLVSCDCASTGKLYLNLYFHLPTTWTHLQKEYQDTCNPNLASLFLVIFFFREPAIQVGLFSRVIHLHKKKPFRIMIIIVQPCRKWITLLTMRKLSLHTTWYLINCDAGDLRLEVGLTWYNNHQAPTMWLLCRASVFLSIMVTRSSETLEHLCNMKCKFPVIKLQCYPNNLTACVWH